MSDSLEEQAIIEYLIDEVKPPMPADCADLHFLRATPFRYRPTRPGSRFRRQDQFQGVFYAAESIETSVAEMAFYRLLFFSESPGTVLPSNPVDFTAFQVLCETDQMTDLTLPPFASDRGVWMHASDYGDCQSFADIARQAGTQVIRYESVRDPAGRANVALLTPLAFPESDRAKSPTVMQTWRLYVRRSGVQAIREFPLLALEYPVALFSADGRISAFLAPQGD